MQVVKSGFDSHIDEAVRKRDRYQFELKLSYPLGGDGATSTYDLACYLFIPSSLGLHRGNYTKARFYDDLRTLTRIRIPSISLDRIVAGPESPMVKLEESAAQLQAGDRQVAVGAFEYRLKLFCCILQSSLRDYVAFINECTDADDRSRLIQQYLLSTRACIDSYRALGLKVFLPTVPREANRIYNFGDEYVSLLVERSCYETLEQLLEGETSGRSELMELIGQEVRHRERRRYPSIPSANSDNEELIFRRNILKKYMHNILYLDARTQKDGAMVEQGLFALAAGVSMLFATIILFLSQSIYGPLTMPVFMALVISYMFKDRIKETLRGYFSQKVSGVLFDHKTRIYSDPNHPIGYCRESVDFMEESRVPADIMRIRDRGHLTEIESDWVAENILRYRKQIKLSSSAISAAYPDIRTSGINDIMRLNVEEFTRRMGNPSKELFVLKEGGYQRVKAERVYHLNMILQYGDDKRTRYRRLRIVLNRRGIKRIEPLSADEVRSTGER